MRHAPSDNSAARPASARNSRIVKPMPEFRKAKLCACGETGFVGLTKGRVALFSPESLPLIEGRYWSCSASPKQVGSFVAVSGDGKGFPRYMHRLVTAAPPGEVVDHVSHDTLDNRVERLRVCSHAQNLWNSRVRRQGKSSQFKGVCWDQNSWLAYIYIDKRLKKLGHFGREVEAARAYDEAAIALRGEFAATNASLGLLSEVAA